MTFVLGMMLGAAGPVKGQEETGFVELPFRTTKVHVDMGAEAKMLQLLNKERIAHGLQPLLLDAKLTDAARKHGREMYALGYFDHVSPAGIGHDARILATGIRCWLMGENIALTQTVIGAHNSLMESPGHRANILYPDFRRVGIGAINGGEYGFMFTQEFTD